MIRFLTGELIHRFTARFTRLYGDQAPVCLSRLRMLIGRYGVGSNPLEPEERWNESDCVLITYGDMVHNGDTPPLRVLKRFLDQRLTGIINTVHILPFFPSSSDDGFSVIDYRQVDPALGSWKDVSALSSHFRLMFDLVLNHCSAKSAWFKDYTNGIMPASQYFLEGNPKADLSAVTRPRTSPLLTKTSTRDGDRWVWTTFSADQVDLDFSNPDVLFEFLDILMQYIAAGARIIRLDAIAYLWKKPGTSCIHLEETHEVVKLMRDVLELVAPETMLLTETNVPHAENISYFGSGDEAHMVYNFSLPQLLVHAIHTNNATHLRTWAKTLSDAPEGCSFFNFTASHDGIGVRPLEGIVPAKEIIALRDAVIERGGQVSTKTNPDGTQSPYELNITYFDIFADPATTSQEKQIARFLCSQTVPMGLKGIPAFYFHSLTATPNWHEGAQETGRARTLNRMKWTEADLNTELDTPGTITRQVFREMLRRLTIRRQHRAFHPDGAMELLSPASKAIFAFTRIAPDTGDGLPPERLIALHNVSDKRVSMKRSALGDNAAKSALRDLLTDTIFPAEGKTIELNPYQCLWLTPVD